MRAPEQGHPGGPSAHGPPLLHTGQPRASVTVYIWAGLHACTSLGTLQSWLLSLVRRALLSENRKVLLQSLSSGRAGIP